MGALRSLLPADVRVVATDSGACGLPAASGVHVELLAAEEAIATFAPAVALCSWMPLGLDWTTALRACSSLREYVLVGDPEICGVPWDTWGLDGDDDDDD